MRCVKPPEITASHTSEPMPRVEKSARMVSASAIAAIAEAAHIPDSLVRYIVRSGQYYLYYKASQGQTNSRSNPWCYTTSKPLSNINEEITRDPNDGYLNG